MPPAVPGSCSVPNHMGWLTPGVTGTGGPARSVGAGEAGGTWGAPWSIPTHPRRVVQGQLWVPAGTAPTQLEPWGQQECNMGGVVTAELGSIFSKSCQILSPSGEEHLALPGQPVLLLLIPNQKCVSPDAAAQESRDMGHQHHRACVTLLGTPAGTKLPPGDTLPAESGFAWCSLAAHVSGPPGPHLLYCIIFSLKKSHVTGDGDLVVVAKGFGSCCQRSPLASLECQVMPCHICSRLVQGVGKYG